MVAGPGARGEDDVGRRVAAVPPDDSDDPVAALVDPRRRCLRPRSRRAAARPPGARRTSFSGSSAPSRAAQSAPAVGPSHGQRAFTSSASSQSLRWLCWRCQAHLRPELRRLGLGRRDPGDPFAPETDVDAGGLAERRGERGVELPTGQAQLEQRVVGVGLDLRGEHAGGGAPGLTHRRRPAPAPATRRPARASSRAQAAPTGPPPTTITS